MAKKIIIIGAGTIGLHCAYYLVRNGHDVEVIDASKENDLTGCSYGNCGFIVPSHFIPLASPAMLKSGFAMLFDRKSPVYLPPFSNLKSIPWFLKFMANANSSHVNHVKQTLWELNRDSMQLYTQILQEHMVDVGFEKNGLLMMSTTQKGWQEEIELSHMANHLGLHTRIIDESALKKLEPHAEFNVAGGVLYESDGHLDPVKHMIWLKNWLANQGVIFHYDSVVKKIEKTKGKISGIHTNFSSYYADEVILAAGVHSKSLAKQVGILLPLIPGKGYSMELATPGWKLNTPIILTEAKVALTPMQGGLRLGSGMEFNGQIGQIRYKRVQTMLNRTHEAIPSFKSRRSKEQKIWEGLRPLSPDGLPYIGRVKDVSNLIVATGHAMMGMSLGPVTGTIVNRLVDNKEPHYNMDLLHPNR